LNWTRLGAFTGSRVSEYAQTTARKGTFTKVPDSLDAGDWRNTPIAFMYCDFTFYDAAKGACGTRTRVVIQQTVTDGAL
jgi:hypothetical protein